MQPTLLNSGGKRASESLSLSDYYQIIMELVRRLN